MTFALWITGLPGSGKSTIAMELLKKLDAEYLRLDEFRKEIVPDPQYSEEERDFVYGKLAEKAGSIFGSGRSVLIDATAHRKRWRDAARRAIPNFIEVRVKCDLMTCVDRESKREQGLVTADLYRKAIERRRTGKSKKGLGEVVGVDVEFEEGSPDIVVESDRLAADESAEKILEAIKRKGYLK